MYIKYNDTDYSCTCRPNKTMVYRDLPKNFPFPVEGEIQLCDDDGFVMRTDNVSDYLRQTFSDGVLTLTNISEPEIKEDTIVEPEPTQLDRIEAQVTYTAMMTDTLLEV